MSWGSHNPQREVTVKVMIYRVFPSKRPKVKSFNFQKEGVILTASLPTDTIIPLFQLARMGRPGCAQGSSHLVHPQIDDNHENDDDHNNDNVMSPN